MRPFTIFTDAGHGWLCVTPADCAVVGLNHLDFSRYSYCDRTNWYLEEDRDAAIFIGAFVAKYDTMPVIHETHVNGQSGIRRKPRLNTL